MDEDIFPAPKHPPKMPEGVEPPTAYSYTVFRQRIAELEGRILATFQNLHHPVHVSDVLALDASMRELQDNLPFYFRARLTKDGVECDKSLDSTYGFLNVHRFLLHTEINSVRIALHRPYLLRSGGPNGAKFLPCREASLNAALHDLEMRSDFVQGIKKLKVNDEPLLLYRVQIGTYKYFHSLLVVGVVMLMDPRAPDAPKMKAHLQHYVDNYQRRPANQRDDMRDREVNVIGIFLSRIEQVEKMMAASKSGTSAAGTSSRVQKRGRSTDASHRGEKYDRDSKSNKRSRDSGAERTDEKSDAHLLLGLGGQKSASAKETGSRTASDGADGRSRPDHRSSEVGESATRSPHHDGASAQPSASGGSRRTGLGSAPPSRQSSGEWTYNSRGLAAKAVGPSTSGSSSNSPTTSALPAVLTGANPGNDSLPTASSTPTMATAPNGGGEDAQQFFDAWYQAEWAAATMPSYDAAYNGANSVGGGAGGVSLGLDSLGSLSGVFGPAAGNTGSAGTQIGQGLGGGFNGLGGPSIGAYGANTPGANAGIARAQGGVSGAGLTPGAAMDGWNPQSGSVPSNYASQAQTSSSNTLADLLNNAQSLSNQGSMWQQQQQNRQYAQDPSTLPGQHSRSKSGNTTAAPNTSSSFGASGYLAPGGPTSQADGTQPILAFDGSNVQDSSHGSGAGQQNFDPAFWQTLIDKIIT